MTTDGLEQGSAPQRDVDPAQPFRLDGYVVRPGELLVETDAGQTHLEPRVMQVLMVLANAAGEVVTRDELIDKVWHGAIVSDESLSRCIYQLRKSLPPEPGKQPLICTIRKRGYRLAVEPRPLDAPGHAERPIISLPGSTPVYVAVAGLLIACLAFFWPATTQREATTDTPDTSASVDTPAIAVLPFRNLGLPDQRPFLAESFPEQLLVGLGRRRPLQVSAWGSSRQFPLESHTPAEIGNALTVDALLSGSIHLQGERMQVTAELISATDGRQLWSGVFDESIVNMHHVQNAITREVVATLNLETADNRIGPLTNTMVAHELYAEGRHYLNQRSSGSFKQAIDYFQQAIDEDPRFAEAYAGLADAHMLATQYELAPLDIATKEAQAAIDRALTINPALAETIASQGLVFLYNGRLADAAAMLRRSTAMNPNYANAHNWLGRALDLQGAASPALAAYRRGLRLDPMSVILNLNVARMLTYTGKLSQADAVLENVVRIDPQFPNAWWALGHNSYLRGDLQQASLHYNQAFDAGLLSPEAMASHAVVLSFQGRFEEAGDWLRRAEGDVPDRHVTTARAIWFALQRDYGGWLEYAAGLIGAHPRDPRFRYLAAQARLHLQDSDAAERLFREGLTIDNDRRVLIPTFEGDPDPLFALDFACALQLNGSPNAAARLLGEARERIQWLRANGLALPSLDYNEAVQLSLSGDYDRALQALRRVANSGWPGVRLAATDPRFFGLQEEPAFQHLLAAAPAASLRPPP